MTTQNKIKDELNKNIFETFGIDEMPEDKQEEAIVSIGEIIFQSVLLRVLPMLKDEELEQYQKLIEANPEPDAVLDFFFEKIPNFMQVIAEEAEKMRKEYEKESKQ